MTPDKEQTAALQAFAKEYGREWKQYLMAAWLSHAYKGRHMGGADTGILRGIRNQFGPSWLSTYRLPKEGETLVARVTVAQAFGPDPLGIKAARKSRR